MMLTSPAIEVTGLTKRFGSVTAVDAIQFALPRGKIHALLGGNGAGKTTTLSMLLGLLTPSAGAIRILGTDLLTRRFEVLPRINFTSPYVDMPYRLTVRQNLDVYARLYGVPDRAREIERLAEDLDLKGFLDKRHGHLSQGQKTRVSLAKALLNRPEVLLMDEPTAALDPYTAQAVRDYLQAFQQGTGASILLASHNMQEVERLCDWVWIMKCGRIVDAGKPDELILRHGHQTLEEVFISIAREAP